MELYQRVWGEQFVLTDEQKADMKAGNPVLWQGEPVRHNGAGRFHVLLSIADMHKPLYENQWLVKKDGQTEILWDEQIRSKYLFSMPVTTKEDLPEPFQSEALRKFLKSHPSNVIVHAQPEVDFQLKTSENAPGPSAPEGELIKPEPATIQNEFGRPETETYEGAPIYDAPKNGESLPIIGQIDNQNTDNGRNDDGHE